MPRGLKRGNQYLPTEFEGSLLLSVLGVSVWSNSPIHGVPLVLGRH